MSARLQFTPAERLSHSKPFRLGSIAPSGDCALAAKGAAMRNIIGDAAEDWAKILSDPANHLHLYGKAAARPGRKMGHVTRLRLV